MKIYILIFFILVNLGSFAQQQTPPPPAPLTAEQKQESIELIAEKLLKTYVYPETAEKYATFLKSRLKSGAYNNISQPKVFADSVTADLYKIYKDKHLSVKFNPGQEQAMKNPGQGGGHTPNPAMEKKMNAGFKNVSIKTGNVGYVRFDNFSQATEGNRKVVDQAFGFIINADALIIDLRYNGGGSPKMVQYISNYLFDKRTHLNSLYNRESNVTDDYYTDVVTPNMANIPVYVLVSAYTFSGGEEFTYNLKNLKRATIVGEVTGGGAHPVKPVATANGMIVNIPFARAINPISKTNWEGTGVTPDVSVPASQALEYAYSKALEQLAENAKGSPIANYFKWHANKASASLNRKDINICDIQKFEGQYGSILLEVKQGQLVYSKKGHGTFVLNPLSENVLAFNDLEHMMIEVVKDGTGIVNALKVSFDNGKTETFEKSKM